ncbi:MAG: glycine zipper family protein [Candidatus Rokuibacteriota bacterium]
MKRWIPAIVAGLAACVVVSAAQAEVFVYPKPGQSQDAFQKDQYECHAWAKQQTGFDPAAPPPTAGAPPPAQGGAVRGAARGAAVGAVGGAIGGDAGKGAAIGAAVGGTAGVMRQNQHNRAAAQASQQAQAQQQTAYGNYERAYATCLTGRGYSVK